MIAIVLGIIVFALVIGASWLMTCGIVKLITLCFGWTFTWPMATGIWLCLWLLGTVFDKK